MTTIKFKLGSHPYKELYRHTLAELWQKANGDFKKPLCRIQEVRSMALNAFLQAPCFLIVSLFLWLFRNHTSGNALLVVDIICSTLVAHASILLVYSTSVLCRKEQKAYSKMMSDARQICVQGRHLDELIDPDEGLTAKKKRDVTWINSLTAEAIFAAVNYWLRRSRHLKASERYAIAQLNKALAPFGLVVVYHD